MKDIARHAKKVSDYFNSNQLFYINSSNHFLVFDQINSNKLIVYYIYSYKIHFFMTFKYHKLLMSLLIILFIFRSVFAENSNHYIIISQILFFFLSFFLCFDTYAYGWFLLRIIDEYFYKNVHMRLRLTHINARV